MRNKFEGKCYICKEMVKKGEGFFERCYGSWRVKHEKCTNVHVEYKSLEPEEKTPYKEMMNLAKKGEELKSQAEDNYHREKFSKPEEETKCTCPFDSDTAREIGHSVNCPLKDKKTWWQEKEEEKVV